VSRRVLKMEDLILSSEADGIEGPTEKLNIVIYGSCEPSGNAELKGHFSYGSYDDNGVQNDDDSPILLQVSLQDGVDVASLRYGEKVTLHMANGSSIDVFLPALEFDRIQEITEYKFWIAEDGSTYWARDEEEGLSGSEVKKSGLYSAEYDPDALACGAYDARLYRYRTKTIAQSPAIDRGTDDAYGYDSTSTNPKVIDMGQPDIGYHYYRRVADDDPTDAQTIEFTFRQPTSDTLGIDGYSVSKVVRGAETHLQDFYQTEPQVKGKEVVDIELNDRLADTEKQHIRVKSFYKPSSGNPVFSAPAEINVIVDPDAPSFGAQ